MAEDPVVDLFEPLTLPSDLPEECRLTILKLRKACRYLRRSANALLDCTDFSENPRFGKEGVLFKTKFFLSLSCEIHKAAEDATELANRMAAELSFIMTSLDLNMDSQNSK